MLQKDKINRHYWNMFVCEKLNYITFHKDNQETVE